MQQKSEQFFSEEMSGEDAFDSLSFADRETVANEKDAPAVLEFSKPSKQDENVRPPMKRVESSSTASTFASYTPVSRLENLNILPDESAWSSVKRGCTRCYHCPGTTAQGSSAALDAYPLTPGWTNPGLTRMSMYQRLEVSSMQFEKEFLGNGLAQVSRRLKSLSVHARYRESPVEACCDTMDQVEFIVAFWESRDDARLVYVEVQRRSGDSYSFARYAQAVLACVKEVVSQQKQEFPFQMGRPELSVAVMEEMEEVDKIVNQTLQEHQSESCQQGNLNFIAEAFGICGSLIASPLRGDRRLGLESLSQMVDPYKSGLSVAKVCAKFLLHGQFPSKKLTPRVLKTIQTRVLGLALTGSWQDEKEGSTSDAAARLKMMILNDDFDEDDAEQRGHDPDACLALMIIANAMELLGLAEEPEEAKEAMNELLTEARCFPDLGLGPIDKLLSMTQNAGSEPHAACFAIKALSAACRVLPEVRNRIQSSVSDMSSVRLANEVGSASHAALESECRRLMETLKA